MWKIKIGIKGWDLPSISSLNQKQLGCSSKWGSTLTQQSICSTCRVPSSVTPLKSPLPVLSWACQAHWQDSQRSHLNEIILVSLSGGGGNEQTVLPCPVSPVQTFQLLAPFPCLWLSSWPSRSCSTMGKCCPKSISMKYYKDYNHQEPQPSAMECNW